MGACCLGLTPSVVTAALLLLLLLPTAPAELVSPGAGEEEDEEEDVVTVVASGPGEVNVVEAAAVPLAGLAATEVAGDREEVGRCWDVLAGAVSASGTAADWAQSPRSSVGGSTSLLVADDCLRAASEDSLFTADRSE